jgi:hypothetical protein
MSAKIVCENGQYNAYLHANPKTSTEIRTRVYNSVIGPGASNVRTLLNRLRRAKKPKPNANQRLYTGKSTLCAYDSDKQRVTRNTEDTAAIFISTGSLDATQWLLNEVTKDMNWVKNPVNTTVTSRPRYAYKVAKDMVGHIIGRRAETLRGITKEEMQFNGTIHYDTLLGGFIICADETSPMLRMLQRIKSVEEGVLNKEWNKKSKSSKSSKSKSSKSNTYNKPVLHADDNIFDTLNSDSDSGNSSDEYSE